MVGRKKNVAFLFDSSISKRKKIYHNYITWGYLHVRIQATLTSYGCHQLPWHSVLASPLSAFQLYQMNRESSRSASWGQSPPFPREMPCRRRSTIGGRVNIHRRRFPLWISARGKPIRLHIYMYIQCKFHARLHLTMHVLKSSDL